MRIVVGTRTTCSGSDRSHATGFHPCRRSRTELSILNSPTDITAPREVSLWVCRGTELPLKLNQICISGRSSFGQWRATAGLDLELVADSGGVIQWFHQ